MNQEIIKRAGELIASKSEYIGGGMEGNCVLALIDKNGYPTASTLTIAKTDGINWLTFCTSPDSNKAARIRDCDRASVCLSSSEYNITLVGTVEIVTDLDIKKDIWCEPMSMMWTGPDDSNFCALRFNTESYNLFFADNESAAEGILSGSRKGATLQVTPGLGFSGQCQQAMELYKKAFGAQIITKIHYSEANPKDFVFKNEAEKDFIYYSEMAIGNTVISLGDDPDGLLDKKSQGASQVSLLIEFETVEKLNAAYQIISEGATILKPICSTTYCTGYVSLVDKFGIHWDLMSGYID